MFTMSHWLIKWGERHFQLIRKDSFKIFDNSLQVIPVQVSPKYEYTWLNCYLFFPSIIIIILRYLLHIIIRSV